MSSTRLHAEWRLALPRRHSSLRLWQPLLERFLRRVPSNPRYRRLRGRHHRPRPRPRQLPLLVPVVKTGKFLLVWVQCWYQPVIKAETAYSVSDLHLVGARVGALSVARYITGAHCSFKCKLWSFTIEMLAHVAGLVWM